MTPTAQEPRQGRANLRDMARRSIRTFFVVAIAASAVAVPAGGEAKQMPTFELGRGDEVFWAGKTSDAGFSCGRGACSSYQLGVAPGGRRLRVAVDDGDFDIFSNYRLEILDPSGKVETAAAVEAFVIDPEPGWWTVNVLPGGGDSDERFRMRAKLEVGNPHRPGTLLKPNLRPEPGYDFSFSWSESTCKAYTEMSCEAPPPLAAPPSCAADETGEDHAARCLRFAMGYQNAGDGPIDLHFGDLDVVSGTVDVTQWVYRANPSESYEDNDHIEVEAGTAGYHKTHGHYHYDNIFGARLFSVDPKTKRIEPLGEVAKRGACAHDYVLVDFERFYQDRQFLADSGDDCSFLLTEPNVRARIGLSTGWADIYTAELSDNYVDFGINLDGHYLLRFYSDIDDTIEESNERDNVAYSYIKVSGFDVELLERGRGRDPWDPEKVVLKGLGD